MVTKEKKRIYQQTFRTKSLAGEVPQGKIYDAKRRAIRNFERDNSRPQPEGADDYEQKLAEYEAAKEQFVAESIEQFKKRKLAEMAAAVKAEEKALRLAKVQAINEVCQKEMSPIFKAEWKAKKELGDSKKSVAKDHAKDQGTAAAAPTAKEAFIASTAEKLDLPQEVVVEFLKLINSEKMQQSKVLKVAMEWGRFKAQQEMATTSATADI